MTEYEQEQFKMCYSAHCALINLPTYLANVLLKYLQTQTRSPSI